LKTRLAKQLLIVHQKYKMIITPLLFYVWYYPIFSLTVTSSFLSRVKFLHFFHLTRKIEFKQLLKPREKPC
jgi:hypothetical protein